jgi:GH25 family lysozyme M1 (1,4-beta-N-acetylmuramidase)
MESDDHLWWLTTKEHWQQLERLGHQRGHKRPIVVAEDAGEQAHYSLSTLKRRRRDWSM